MNVEKGTSKIYVIGGKFSNRKHDFESIVEKDAPMLTELIEVIDSVANLINLSLTG